MSDSKTPDLLNSIGHAILRADTRWIIVAAVLFLVVYCGVLRLAKRRWVSRDDAVSLGLALLQFYSAPVLFCLLVLTEPPALELVGKFERQGAGVLAFIFLASGVFIEIRRIWVGKDSLRNEGHPPQPLAEHKRR